VGLGSGTQLALAVGRVIGELYGRGGEGADLARAAGRGRRSGIGTYIFDGGGLIVEGGHHQERDGPAPLIVRLPIPASWRAVIAIPDAPAGVSGGAERDAFRNLPPPPPREVERVSHLVLMGLLPAVVEDDLPAFGSALTALQTITGRWFEAAQGGAFAPGPTRELVRSLPEWGALGVGQSSWGPTVYGLVRGEVEVERLAERMREAVGASGCVYQGPLGSDGARVWRRNQSE
jgi:beta-RFAP synthase